MSITQRKQELRRMMRNEAKKLNSLEMRRMADNVFSRVELLDEFKQASVIACYWSMPDELPTHTWLKKWAAEKQIVLPVTEDGKMFFRTYVPSEEMNKGELNYLEPQEGDIVNPNEIDLMLVPGVAFDAKGGRLGRGRAYYDSYLSNSRAYKMGVCMAHQLIDEVPREKHDQLLDKVIWSES